jgi:hypothetical protein
MDPVFLTSEDIDNLCDECTKDSENGTLALIALLNYLPSLEDAKEYSQEGIDINSSSLKKSRLILYLSILMCVCFCSKIPVYHILFWINLSFPIISFLTLRYYKSLVFIYTKDLKKVSDQLEHIKKALDTLKVNINS